MSVTDRLYRRVLMALSTVKITATNDKEAVHRAQVRVNPRETIDNVPVLQIYGLASHATTGSDALAVFLGGDRSRAVVVATGNQKARLRNLEPGEVALYTDEGDVIRMKRNREIEITNGTKVRIVTPRLEVTGDIIDHCDEQAHTDADMRAIYNAHRHTGGSGTPTLTGVPTTPMVREGDEE